MASLSPLTDLTENFFQCSVCLDQFKEPKQLPCLHRYCRDCLDKIIQASNGKTFKCPICKQNCEISKDGVDSFKTDFHMKSMLEFIQLQKSIENEDLKECVSCSKKLKMSVYCFKCLEFLCDQCGEFHKNNKLFKDHKVHILNLDSAGNKESMLEKLTSLTQNPRCNHHVEQEALLCCCTCGNIPVCVICVYSKHKGHDLHDVSEISGRERESLKRTLLDINKHKDRLYDLPHVIDKSIKKLRGNVKNQSEKINFQYQQQLEKNKDKMKQRKAEREENMENIKARREKEINDVRKKHEEEMKQVVEKYAQELNEADKKHDQIMEKNERDLRNLDSNLKELTEQNEKMSRQNETGLQEISEYCEQIIKRYENFTATTSSILDCNDKWADAQCIPDIRAASEHLLEEMKKEFPELNSLSNFEKRKLRNVSVDAVAITDKYESIIDVKGFNIFGSGAMTFTNIDDGMAVITGVSSNGNSQIIVINRDGTILRQDNIKHADSRDKVVACCRFSQFKVVTLSQNNEVGIYDVRDGSHNTKNIKTILRNSCSVKRVTADTVKDHIIVFAPSVNVRDVYVFDERLNHIKTTQLPDAVGIFANVSVRDGNILVCRYSRSLYEVRIEGSIGHVVCEFMTPDIDGGGSSTCVSVCSDENGFVYAILRTRISGKWKYSLVQYSQDGTQIQRHVTLDQSYSNVTTAKQNDEEVLVLNTYMSNKLYTKCYRLEVPLDSI